MSAKLNTSDPNNAASITQIDANSRIDYVLRFSQHPAVVIAENADVYQLLVSNFVANLSDNINVALLQASEKLTNIQCRCRIIEQLFPNQVFDPEQPLYKSLLPLINENINRYCIIVEHGQSLTRQILHELCQLNEQLNANTKLNIVIFGDNNLAQKLVADKTVFQRRLTMIHGNNGQILPWRQTKLAAKPRVIASKYGLIALLLVTFLVSLVVAVLMNQPNIDAWFKTPVKDESLSKIHESKPQLAAKTQVTVADKTRSVQQNHLASTIEIFDAIMQQASPPKLAEQQPKLASSIDVLQALLVAEDTSKTTSKENSVMNQDNAGDKSSVVKQLDKAKILDPSYYISLDKGFVIQFAGFTTQAEYQAYLALMQGLPYQGYYKRVNGKPYLVITSLVYKNKQQAEQAVSELPEKLMAAGPWIRKVADIKAELSLSIDKLD